SAWKIAKRSKKLGATTIIGGPHVSALPEESAALPQVDFVCIGEGEETMLEFCQAITGGKERFEKIRGICFKKGRKVVYTQTRPLIKNLDSLPFPAYHLFKLPLYTSAQPLISTRKPAMGIVTSRGCPCGCKFCYKGTFGRNWRPRGVKNVLAEWEYLVKTLKIAEIALLDDAFNLDIDRAIRICQEIKKKNLVIPWRSSSGIRADRAPKKLLRAMKDSGCYHIAFGVESGVQRVLNLMGKELNLKEVTRTFKTCRQLGISTMAFFMIGYPGETQEEIKKKIDFSIKLDPDFAQFTVSTPFPGTQIFNLIKKEGKIKIVDWDKYYMFGNKGYFDFGEIKIEEVTKLVSQAYRRFYLRPKTIFRLIKKRQTWLNLPNVIAGSAYYLLPNNL
ncbi:MAG: B12-binding domain-containing radical SAM protein, partial [Candidatus Marinimicrobia bacterium]|nr:B12-binding domain-containing radical SAM protein [Candidatus Neomarinimicrobiota bacterium]